MYKNCLILAPHTDDAELGCGGTIAKFLEEGVNVHVAAFSTARQSLSSGIHRDKLKYEFVSAMNVMGVAEKSRYIYDYEVRKLSYSRQEVLEEIVKLRDIIKPEIVLLPSGSDLHQDHEVVFKEGVRACKFQTVLGYELPWNHITFSAQAFIGLKDRHIVKKWDSLKKYESQFEKKRPYFEEEFIRGLARLRGVQSNCRYAEAFEVVKIRIV